MKRILLTATVLLVVLFGGSAHAHAGERVSVLLAGSGEADAISISNSPDGRSYVIASALPLEVGASVCIHPDGLETELVCEAAAIVGFEVNAGAGDDVITVAAGVSLPVTLRGGAGNDRLTGGGGSDRLSGGSGEDVLVGRAGKDVLMGGPGNDRLIGGPGEDVLRGEEGEDVLIGGPGANTLFQ